MKRKNQTKNKTTYNHQPIQIYAKKTPKPQSAKQIQYYVKWPDNHFSWEPISKLSGVLNLIDKFQQRHNLTNKQVRALEEKKTNTINDGEINSTSLPIKSKTPSIRVSESTMNKLALDEWRKEVGQKILNKQFQQRKYDEREKIQNEKKKKQQKQQDNSIIFLVNDPDQKEISRCEKSIEIIQNKYVIKNSQLQDIQYEYQQNYLKNSVGTNTQYPEFPNIISYRVNNIHKKIVDQDSGEEKIFVQVQTLNYKDEWIKTPLILPIQKFSQLSPIILAKYLENCTKQFNLLKL